MIKYLICLLFFIISPGFAVSQEILEVDEIEFQHKDKQTFDEGQLNDVIALSKSKIFSSKILENDIIKLKMFYFDNGFFSPEVDTSVIIDHDDNEVKVKFIITENTRYKIDSLEINGLENISTETLSKVRRIKTIEKQYYSKSMILQYTNMVLDTLQNNGYMNAAPRTDSGTIVTRDKERSSVKVTVKLTGTDTVYYFGKTDIQINNNEYGLRTEIPREEIVYKEGEIYSKARLLESERNMGRIAIISNAKINKTGINGNRVDFTSVINLGKKNELTPFIKGSNFENRFYVGAGIRYLNKYFLSGNQTLILELEEDFNSLDINRTELSASVTKPHFIGKRITLINRLSIGFNNVERYKNYFAVNLTTLNYFIANYTFYNNAYLDLTEELIWIKYDTIQTGRQTLFNSFLGFTLEHDNTNNVLSPSAGFYHSVTAGASGLLPKLVTGILSKDIFYSQFFKAYTLNKIYFSLSSKQDNTVLAANVKTGDIIEYGRGENIIPVQPLYKFFSGGSGSLRGWGAKENGILENTFNGGTFLFEGSVELRKKLFPESENFTKNIGAAFFIDYGNVWETHKDFRFSQVAFAIGFGVRYDIFIGPIRFDFGFKLYDPSAEEGNKWLTSGKGNFLKDKFTVHFGIGQAF